MLQSLMSLSDEDVSAVIAAVHKYCGDHGYDLHSPQGRRTITTALELVQNKCDPERLIFDLDQRLHS
ncbi:hypothetical protein J5277_17980 [Rhizobium sp. 16-449-1b]|uniref:hypothetical protein n=1 Tax=Rhizobium sp. 16-449-1b TaxID=2819989 RepID=UPI001ADD3114|nr:hypothetical protein [Rhizobium sp. 16-449-1b]MBO9195994.1 hypothetical protein [Rhizobium sp. 16-449-1b]